MPSGVKAILMPHGANRLPIQPFVGIERGQRDAGDGGGQRERQVDRRVEQALAGKLVAHQHPGHDHAEHGIDQGGGGRDEEAHLEGGQHARRGGDAPDAVEAELAGARHQHGERDQHDQRQVADGEAERQPEAGQRARLANPRQPAR